MLLRIVSILLLLIAVFFAAALIRENILHRDLDPISLKGGILLALTEAAIWFLATFGVSDTAVNLVVFKSAKLTDTRRTPGTIIMGAVVPVSIMSVTYLSKVEADTATVVCLIIFQSLAGFLGASLVKRMNIRVIRVIMAAALIVTAIFLFAKIYVLHLEGGNTIGVSGWKLIFAIVVCMFTQALAMLGFGNTTSNIALLLLLGVSPVSVYPIVMSSNSFGAAMGGVKFLKDGDYNRKVALIEAAGGGVGVILAVNLVAGMNMRILQILMILLMLYSAASMVKENMDEKKAGKVSP